MESSKSGIGPGGGPKLLISYGKGGHRGRTGEKRKKSEVPGDTK